jgi:hypothetical protein
MSLLGHGLLTLWASCHKLVDRNDYYGGSVSLQRLIRPPVLRTVRDISA